MQQKICVITTTPNYSITQNIANPTQGESLTMQDRIQDPVSLSIEHKFSAQIISPKNTSQLDQFKAAEQKQIKRIKKNAPTDDLEGKSLEEMDSYFDYCNEETIDVSWVQLEGQGAADASLSTQDAATTTQIDTPGTVNAIDKISVPALLLVAAAGWIGKVLVFDTSGETALARSGLSIGNVNATTTVTGTFVAGPVILGHRLSVKICDVNGDFLGDSLVGNDGTFSIDIGSHTGIIIAKVIDDDQADANNNDFLDEATGQYKDINAVFMAVSVVVNAGTVIVLHINAATTLAAVKAGLNVSDGSGSIIGDTETDKIATVSAVNSAVAQIFDQRIQITQAKPEAIINPDGTQNPSANSFGKILAAISGVDKTSGGDMAQSINAMAQAISGAGTATAATLNQSGQALLLSGATNAGLDPVEVAALIDPTASAMATSFNSSSVITELSPAVIASLSAQQLDGLTSSQAATINSNQLVAIRDLGSLGNNLQNLSVVTVIGINSGQLQSLTNLSLFGANLSNLNPSAMASLNSTQVASIIRGQLASFDSSDIQALSSSAIIGLTPELVASLSDSQLNALTSGQIAALQASGDLDQLTAQQRAQLTHDATAPATPVFSLSGATLTLTQPERGATFKIYNGNDDVTNSFTFTANGDGTFTAVALSGAFSGGEVLTVKAVDAKNNVSGATSSFSIDSSAPALSVTQTSINIAGDGVINAVERTNGVALSGTTEPGRYVTISTGTGSDITVASDATTGAWSTTVGAANLPTNGIVTFTVTGSDAAGNMATVTRSVSVDAVPPTALLISGAGNASSASVTVQSSETGTAYLVKTWGTEPIDVIDLSSITSAPDAKWNSVDITNANTDTSLSLAGLEEGTYVLYSVNAVGNLSGGSVGVFTLDFTAPTLLSSTPSNEAVGISVGNNLTFTYNESIAVGSGDIVLKNLTDGTQTTIAVTDATQVSISGNTLTLNPTTDLLGGKNYAVQIQAGAIHDAAGNSYAGISDDTTLNFSTSIAPGASIISLGSWGQLIAPVQVEGKWYYAWDRNSDGVHDILGDGITMTDLASITGINLNLDIIGSIQHNGISLTLPNLGSGYGDNVYVSVLPGTAWSNSTPGWDTSGTSNTTYDDLQAIWDAFNGIWDPVDMIGEEFALGTPPGWGTAAYLTASPVRWTDGVSQYIYPQVVYPDGTVSLAPNDSNSYLVAFQVL